MSNRSRLIPSGFPRLPLKNGINRVVCQLKRITIKFCKESGSSTGVRSFVEHDLLDYSRNNPEVAVYLKPRRHHHPVFITEYLNGERHYQYARNFSRDNVNKWLSFLRTRVGHPTTKLRKLQHTELPSVQGVWSPFTNRDPKLNLITFPNDELNVPKNMHPSATERLRKLFEQQKRNEEQNKNADENLEIEVQR